eukprot:GHVH01004003.1.p1 GENE.GHVH01004003.1~~GHVH01004003.1.p1  ORF type:complete len:493 (-),score=56.58 GHVH01004003.1:200-1678(-)
MNDAVELLGRGEFAKHSTLSILRYIITQYTPRKAHPRGIDHHEEYPSPVSAPRRGEVAEADSPVLNRRLHRCRATWSSEDAHECRKFRLLSKIFSEAATELCHFAFQSDGGNVHRLLTNMQSLHIAKIRLRSVLLSLDTGECIRSTLQCQGEALSSASNLEEKEDVKSSELKRKDITTPLIHDVVIENSTFISNSDSKMLELHPCRVSLSVSLQSLTLHNCCLLSDDRSSEKPFYIDLRHCHLLDDLNIGKLLNCTLHLPDVILSSMVIDRSRPHYQNDAADCLGPDKLTMIWPTNFKSKRLVLSNFGYRKRDAESIKQYFSYFALESGGEQWIELVQKSGVSSLTLTDISAEGVRLISPASMKVIRLTRCGFKAIDLSVCTSLKKIVLNACTFADQPSRFDFTMKDSSNFTVLKLVDVDLRPLADLLRPSLKSIELLYIINRNLDLNLTHIENLKELVMTGCFFREVVSNIQPTARLIHCCLDDTSWSSDD